MVWERRSYNDGSSVRCTVKFRGFIPQWGTSVALGVEWDDPRRGKNNGSLDGVEYMHARVPGACSFVRESRPDEGSVSFAQALSKKYLQHSDSQKIQLSDTKYVETYGFDKVESMYADLPSLSFVSLEACLVKSLEWTDFSQFLSLVRLDLSNNLLERFAEVPPFLNQFPTLKNVRLSGNRLVFAKSREECSMESLELCDAALIDDEADIVMQAFPKLKTLSLANNCLSRVPQIPGELEELDLSGNAQLVSIGFLPFTVRRASFQGTAIKALLPSDTIPRSCDLRNTALISEDTTGRRVINWEAVSELDRHGVEELDFLGAFDLENRGFVIARCGELKKLDGTVVDSEARLNAEKHVIAAVVQNLHPKIPESRWNQLVRAHGLPYVKSSASIDNRLVSFFVDGKPLCTLGDSPVYRLRALVARLTDQDTELMEIEGITDTGEYDPGSVWKVKDLIAEGQNLRTYLAK